MMPSDWTQISAFLGVIGILVGVVLWALRASLRGLFAERRALEVLERRVSAVEARIAEGPTGDDMRELYRRMGSVETQMASATTAIGGVDHGVKRVEHMLGLLLQHELARGNGNEPG
jgi:hypothetical protein